MAAATTPKKRMEVSLDPDVAKVLRLTAADADRDVSVIVERALRRDLSEGPFSNMLPPLVSAAS